MDIITATIEEWRELGFHYDLDDAHRVWTLTGSPIGLSRFAEILRQFASNPRNDIRFEHDHYGPYGYLKVMSNPDDRGFNSNAIFAPRCEFSELADLIDSRLANSKTGSTIDLSHDFAPNSEYELRLIVAPEDFDPGLFDPWVQQKISEQSGEREPPMTRDVES